MVLKTGFSAVIPINRDRIDAYKSVPSVESIQLMTIIEAKTGQNGRMSKCATLFACLGVESNYNLYRLQS